MIKILFEMASAGLMHFARGRFTKRAFAALAEEGLIQAGVKEGSRAGQAILKKIAKSGMNPEAFLKSRLTTMPGALRTMARTPALERSVQTAMTNLRRAKYAGAAANVMFAAPAFAFGFSMLSGADQAFQRNIPPAPAMEIARTQQMFMPRQAYTQRQRAIQAIHQSQLTTRSALGNEAQYMHG